MGRRHRIFPKAGLVQFPQNSLNHQASSMLLSCPPHRISRFWEKEDQSRAQLTSLLNQQSSNSKPLHHHNHKNVQEPPPWLKHPAIASKMPQLDNRAMVVPLPHLHHLAKPSPHHKHRTVAPVLPLPRTYIPTKKTTGALTTFEHCLIHTLGPKHQQDSPSDPDHQLENPSSSDHLPKIFPACDHLSIEDLTPTNQKDPIPPYQTEVPLGESYRCRVTTVGKIGSDTQDKTNGPLAKTTTQRTRALPRPRRRIKATNALLGLFNLDPVFHPLVKSIPFTLWTRVPHFRTSVLNYWVQAHTLKASHCDVQPREAVSLVQYHDRHPRPSAVPASHLNQRNRSTAVCRYNSHLLPSPCSIAHVSVQTEEDNWETMLLRKYLLETCSSDTDVEPSITSPELSISVNTDKDPWETISQGTDIQDAPPSSPDLEITVTPEPSVHVAIQAELDTWDTISPTDLQEILPCSPDIETDLIPEPTVHVSIQTEPDPWETISPETEMDKVSSTGQDDMITPLDSSPQDKTLSAPPRWSTPPSSPDPCAEHMPDSNALITLHPELEQRKTPPEETDHLAILPSSPDLDTKNMSEPIIPESLPITQEYWETISPILSGISNQQEITLTDEDHEITPPLGLDDQERILSSPGEATTPLPNPYHQAEDVQATLHQKLQQWATLSEETNLWDILIPNTESETENTPVLTDPISDVIEQEKFEIMDITPLRIEKEEPNQLVEDHGEISLCLGNDDQENALPGPDHQVTPPLSPDQKQETEDTAHDLAQDLVQTRHKSGEQTRTDLNTTILTDEEEEVMLPVDLGPEDPAHLVLEPHVTSPPSPDQQAEDIPDLSAQVSPQPEPDPSDIISAGTEFQGSILGEQGQSITPPLSLDHEEMTLSSPDHCVTHPPSPDRQSEAAEDLSPQAVSPTNREHSAKLSKGQEQVTCPPSSNPLVTLPSTSENEIKARTEVTNVPSTPLENLDDKEIVPLSHQKTVSPPSSYHQTEAPTGRDNQPKTELSSDHQDEVESGLPHQFHIEQKRQSKLPLNYIKPYTIEAGTVSDRTVQSIINSIPQEKIKNDICKQILLPPSFDGYTPCDYMVCLICASWIPDGCPHEGMKYPCEAQLLAIPIPMPMSEKINVKFVLKCPQTTVSSLFSTSNTHSHLKKSSEGTESSHSDSVVPVLSRPKWLHFILGKSLPQGKRDITRSSELSIDKVLEEGSSSNDREKAKVHRMSFRSLLERFQWRQKETK